MATPQTGEYIRPASDHPSGRPARNRLLRVLDEHDPAGGRGKAALFLLHPGPSLLVTAVTVAAAAIALRAAPDASLAVRLVLLMLPAQFAIGAANDLADLAADRAAKPHKPLVRGAVRPVTALLATLGFVAVSLGSAASLGPPVLAATAVGLAAGLAYDLGLKRGAASWVPWWVAFTALPLCAYAAAGRFTLALWWCVPVTAILAIGLHCANALPDIEGDRRSGVVSLPVALGERRARRLALAGPLATVALTGALAAPLHQRGPWLPLAWAAVVLATTGAASSRRLGARPFVVLAPACAVLAIAWLGALPG